MGSYVSTPARDNAQLSVVWLFHLHCVLEQWAGNSQTVKVSVGFGDPSSLTTGTVRHCPQRGWTAVLVKECPIFGIWLYLCFIKFLLLKTRWKSLLLFKGIFTRLYLAALDFFVSALDDVVLLLAGKCQFSSFIPRAKSNIRGRREFNSELFQSVFTMASNFFLYRFSKGWYKDMSCLKGTFPFLRLSVSANKIFTASSSKPYTLNHFRILLT